MDLHALRAELEPLTHRARVAQILALGRAARSGDTAASETLTALGRDLDTYLRALAVHALFVTHDAAALLAFLADDSHRVRHVALRAAPHVLTDDDDAARAVAAAVPTGARTKLVLALWRRGRTRPAELYLDSVPHDLRALPLLAFTSAEYTRARLATVGDRLGPEGWQRLAKHHSGLVGGALLHALSAAELDRRVTGRLWLVLDCLVDAAPDVALTLLERMLELGDGALSYQLRSVAQALTITRPARLFDLLRRIDERASAAQPPGAFAGLRLSSVAARLGADRLAYTIRHAWVTLGDGRRGERWFRTLSPDVQRAVVDAWLQHGRGVWGAFLLRHADHAPAALREAAFVRWCDAARSQAGVIAPHALADLPRALREREARRHLTRVPVLDARPRERTAYAALLPLEETLALLKPFLGHPEGDERAAALAVLVSSVRHDRARLPAVLATLRQRKFEQDPVRQAMLGALAALPAGCFRATDLEALAAIFQDALDAADLSSSTSSIVEGLVVRLFRIDAAWGADWLGRVLARRGSVSAGGLGTQLARRMMPALAPHLEALATAWSTRERYGALLWLAASLGPRLAQVPGVLDALESVLRLSRETSTASQALALLREADAPRVTRLLPELLQLDASYVALGGVADFLSMHRQDLLTPFLDDAPTKGRFATGRTRWIITFTRGTQRWTADQQRLYANALARITDDAARDVGAIRGAVDGLVQLAYVAPTVVLRLARDPRPPVRELAVRALARLDGRGGVPELIEALGDDRARWAIYALRKIFALMPRAAVLSHLARVPTQKVTVAKEVVRLLGELGGDDAFVVLHGMWSQPLHRDVRIALLRALWDHLDRPETWAAFAQAVADPDWVVATKLADLPLARLTTAREAQAVELLVKILERPEPEARLAILGRARSLRVADASRRWFGALLAHYRGAHDDEALAAADAVREVMRASEVSVVVDTLDALRRRPHTLRATLSRWSPHAYAAAHHREVGVRVVERLSQDPLLAALRVEFAASFMSASELTSLLLALSRSELLHYDVMREADAAVARAAEPGVLESALGASRDPRLRRLALSALLADAAPGRGWTAAHRARLSHYRSDADLGVAGAAAAVHVLEDVASAEGPPDDASNRATVTSRLRQLWTGLTSSRPPDETPD